MKVEIVETETETETETDVEQKEDGSFELIISEATAVNIDDCERAVLRTHYPAIRETISKHLTEMSEEKQQKPVKTKDKEKRMSVPIV